MALVGICRALQPSLEISIGEGIERSDGPAGCRIDAGDSHWGLSFTQYEYGVT
jgi:hypothetical protein